MKKKDYSPLKFDSISAAHQAFGLPRPLHPLISLVNTSGLTGNVVRPSGSHLLNFYKISLRSTLGGSLKYGQGHYDFTEGGITASCCQGILGLHRRKDEGLVIAGACCSIPPFEMQQYLTGLLRVEESKIIRTT